MVEEKTAASAYNKSAIDSHYQEIRGVYEQYRTIVRPFISFLELFDREFPVEILNEIRAIFQHLARCYTCEFDIVSTDDSSSEEEIRNKQMTFIGKNIDKANSHINRALLDCFKYSCLTLHDEYVAFMNMYKNVDISSLDNGEFLKKLHILKTNAKRANNAARILEGDTGDETAVFRQYEKSFNEFVKLYDYIDHHAKYAARLKHKLRFKEIFAAIGWIVGVVSGLLALWEAFGTDIIAWATLLFQSP